MKNKVEFISRKDAHVLLDIKEEYIRLRNYELEYRLSVATGDEWVITDWCPFNGRYCRVAMYIPLPHPAMYGKIPTQEEGDLYNYWKGEYANELY